jgi:hypothetical protein
VFKRNANGAVTGEKLRWREARGGKAGRVPGPQGSAAAFAGTNHIWTEISGLGQANEGSFA